MSGKLLRATLDALDQDASKVWIGNSFLCGDGYITPTPEILSACQPGLFEELRECKPKAILLCGATALEQVLGLTKISAHRGRYYWSDELNCFCIPTWHPAYILRNPSKFTEFQKDLDRALKVARGQNVPNLDPVPPARISVREYRHLADVIMDLDDAEMIALDIETEGFDPRLDKIIRIGLLADESVCYILYPEVFDAPMLKTFLERRDIEWVGHNGQFDSMHLKQQLGINWLPTQDTMLMHYCVDEMPGHRLKTLAAEYLGATKYDQVLRSALDEEEGTPKTFADVPDDILDEYLAWDCYYTYALVAPLRREMLEEGSTNVHDNILIPASHAFRDIELYGALIDVKYLESLKVELMKTIDQQEHDLREMIGIPDFNVRSTKQVRELLYDTLKIPDKSKRKSTEKEMLEPLAKDYPAVDLILKIRQMKQIISTYVDGLLRRVDSNNRVHSDFLLHGTQTGRLSSRDPNLQNIPTLIGPMIRKAFIAPPGYVFVEADFSQAELRVAAWYSGDHFLTNAYREGRDIHRVVASQVFNVPEEEVTYEQRYIAKYIDFGILYGRQAESLALGELQCSIAEAQGYIDQFMGQFDGLRTWIETQHQGVVHNGFVETPMGRRRRFPLLLDRNISEAQRQAVNTPIQSLASDMTLLSLVELHNTLDPDEARIVSTVHDSILLEVREDVIDRVGKYIVDTMKTVPMRYLGDKVPFKADLGYAVSWGDIDK